ncbi:GFA family protein [Acinetobacter sp. S40]|uniref:GFA family protein n=1 Tax=unclassified Acinetobacter TaxID=196816 RepID=UPI00190BD925|nr:MULTISPECIES: GFA family protein [unclassified Acinetobacter]MBJ9984387.1 GFA family protein [Acinetobacter sp. S40]MBK0062104.1 GFA family protein [Acinetobacter sp. S55]MBK0065908.1 GFA family protein [Acinetobacter sp. S54]
MLGQCLCGTVKFEVNIRTEQIAVCHCSMCRKWGGGPSLTLEVVDHLKVTGEKSIGKYASSEWAARYFCKECGTNLYYKLNERDYYSVNAQLFELPDHAKIHLEIYTDHKPAYYPFLSSAKRMTEQDVIDLFSSEN